MVDKIKAISNILRDPVKFVSFGAQLNLRNYQIQPALSIIDSVLHRRGHSFVVMFPRQSGKNELQAQIEAYLLMILSATPAEIVKISPTWKPQTLNAMRRLERVLSSNRFTAGRWAKDSGYIYRIKNARIFFLSGQPTANIVGATASTLLSVDEAQEINIEKYDKEIAPMAASTNATRVFWGTAWTTATLLARELRNSQAAEFADGVRRVFRIDADDVAKEVIEYGTYVRGQVARLSRAHPLIKTQFYSEELDGEGGLFPPERLEKIKGMHSALEGPQAGRLYAFLLDFAGEDAGASTGDLSRPTRDATALTVVEVDTSHRSDILFRAPLYRCVHRQEWRGANHAALVGALHQLATLWHPKYIVTDATGLGAPLTSFLDRSFPHQVIPFVFTSKSKSALGWDFIALLDSCRWQEYATGNETQLKYQAEFYRQMKFTAFDVKAGLLHWGVPDGTRDSSNGDTIHDDWIISAALATLLDEQSFATTMPSDSHFIRARDPLNDMDKGF